jgi:hypothetical protein
MYCASNRIYVEAHKAIWEPIILGFQMHGSEGTAVDLVVCGEDKQCLAGTDQVHTKVQDFLVKFGELLPTIFVSTL